MPLTTKGERMEQDAKWSPNNTLIQYIFQGITGGFMIDFGRENSHCKSAKSNPGSFRQGYGFIASGISSRDTYIYVGKSIWYDP